MKINKYFNTKLSKLIDEQSEKRNKEKNYWNVENYSLNLNPTGQNSTDVRQEIAVGPTADNGLNMTVFKEANSTTHDVLGLVVYSDVDQNDVVTFTSATAVPTGLSWLFLFKPHNSDGWIYVISYVHPASQPAYVAESSTLDINTQSLFIPVTDLGLG